MRIKKCIEYNKFNDERNMIWGFIERHSFKISHINKEILNELCYLRIDSSTIFKVSSGK